MAERKPRKEAEKRPLDTLEANNSLWLLKIPDFIAQRWEGIYKSSESANPILGNLYVTPIKDASGKVTKKIKLKLLPEEGHTGPSVDDFIVEELPGGPQLYAFNYDEESKSFAVSGKVTKNCNLMPENANAFGNLQIALGEQREEERRRVKVLDRKMLEVTADPSKTVPFIPPILVEKKKKFQAGSDRTEVMENIFAAFKKDEHLTLKDLMQYCSCPEQELKQLVKDFCDYNSKGKLKNFYQLKKEFRE